MCFCFRVIDVLKVVDQKDEEVEFYRKKFAGSQADRIVRAEAEAEKVAEQLKKTKVSGLFVSLSNGRRVLIFGRKENKENEILYYFLKEKAYQRGTCFTTKM